MHTRLESCFSKRDQKYTYCSTSWKATVAKEIRRTTLLLWMRTMFAGAWRCSGSARIKLPPCMCWRGIWWPWRLTFGNTYEKSRQTEVSRGFQGVQGVLGLVLALQVWVSQLYEPNPRTRRPCSPKVPKHPKWLKLFYNAPCVRLKLPCFFLNFRCSRCFLGKS